MVGFNIPETLFNQSQANDLQDFIDEQEHQRQKDLLGPASYDAPTSVTPPASPAVATDQPIIPPTLASPPRTAPEATPPLTGDADRGVGLTPRPGGAFSPYDDIFRRHAGDLASDPQFISIVAAGTKAESGWNTDNRTGDNGHSWGLFQMHDGGAGAGMGAARLDPNAASAVMVPRYAEAYRKYTAQGLTGSALASAVAAYAERPLGWDDPNSTARQNYAKEWATVTGSPYTGAPQGNSQVPGGSPVGDTTVPPLPNTPTLPPNGGIDVRLLSGAPETGKLNQFINEQNKRVEAAHPWIPPAPSVPEKAPGIGDIPEGIRQLTNRLPGPAGVARSLSSEQQISNETAGEYAQMQGANPAGQVPSTTEMYGPDGSLTQVGQQYLAQQAMTTPQFQQLADKYNMATKAARGGDLAGNPAADRNPDTTQATLALSAPLVAFTGLYTPEVLSNAVIGNIIDPEGLQILALLKHVPEVGQIVQRGWGALGEVGRSVAAALDNGSDLPVVGGVQRMGAGVSPAPQNYLTIIHESATPGLTSIDPAARGTGLVKGAEREWPEDPGRTFWHVADAGPTEVKGVGVDPRTQNLERGFGGHLYAAAVNPDDLAVVHLTGMGGLRPQDIQAAADSGKLGYMVPERNQVHLFNPQEVKYMGVLAPGRTTTTTFRDLLSPPEGEIRMGSGIDPRQDPTGMWPSNFPIGTNPLHGLQGQEERANAWLQGHGLDPNNMENRLSLPEEFRNPGGDLQTRLQALVDQAKNEGRAGPTAEELSQFAEAPRGEKGLQKGTPASYEDVLAKIQAGELAKDWYPELGKWLHSTVGDDLGDAVFALFGPTSNQAPPELNAARTFHIMATLTNLEGEGRATFDNFKKTLYAERVGNGGDSPLGVSDDQIKKAWAIYTTGVANVPTGQKTVVYADALKRAAEGLPRYNTVMDRHSLSLVGFNAPTAMGSDKAVQYGRAIHTVAGKELGMLPDEAQAAGWFVERLLKQGNMPYKQILNEDGLYSALTKIKEDMPNLLAAKLPGSPSAVAADPLVNRELDGLRAAIDRYGPPSFPKNIAYTYESRDPKAVGLYQGVPVGGILQGATAGAAGAQIQDQMPGEQHDPNRLYKGAAVGAVLGGVLGAGVRREGAQSGIPFGGKEPRPSAEQPPLLPEGATYKGPGRPMEPQQPDLGLEFPRGPEQIPMPGPGEPPILGGSTPSPAGVDTKTAWTRETLSATPQAQKIADLHGEPARTAAVNAVTTLQQAGASQEQIDQFWRKAVATPKSWTDPKAWNDWFTAVAYNSMLSSPSSAAVQVLGNSLELPWKVAGDIMKTANHPASLLAEAQGAIEGFREGARGFGSIMRYGQSTQGTADWERTRLGDMPGIGGKIGGALESPGRTFSALDHWAAAVVQRMEQGRLAGLQASKEGLGGSQWSDRVGVLMDDPTILRRAHQEAAQYALHGEMGRLGQVLQGVQRYPVVGTVVMPFLKTIYNEADKAADRLPLVGAARIGADMVRGVYKDAENIPTDRRALSTRIADNLTGTAAFAYMWQQAMDGNVSGSGPSDAREMERLKRLGWQPYSVKLPGDRWVQYSNLGSIATPLAAVAAAAESVKYGDPQADQFKTIADAIRRWAKATEDNGYLSTLGGLFNMTDPHQDPEKTGQRLIADEATKLIPGTALARSVANAQDPYQREYKSVGDRLGSINPMPGARDQYPPKLDVYGQPLPANATGVEALTPLRLGQTATGHQADVDRELGRLQHNIGDPARTPNGHNLTDEQHRAMIEATGPKIRDRLEKLVEAPSWGKVKDTEKIKRITAEVDRIRTAYATKNFRTMTAAQKAAQAATSGKGPLPTGAVDEYGTRK